MEKKKLFNINAIFESLLWQVDYSGRLYPHDDFIRSIKY